MLVFLARMNCSLASDKLFKIKLVGWGWGEQREKIRCSERLLNLVDGSLCSIDQSQITGRLNLILSLK